MAIWRAASCREAKPRGTPARARRRQSHHRCWGPLIRLMSVVALVRVHVWYSLDSSTSSRSASGVKKLMNMLHHHVSSMLSIRHKDGFDSLSNNLGRIPNLARTVASKSIIFCFVFYYSLVDEFSTCGGLAFSTNLINVFVRIWITDQTYYRF
jgi:hypothetical protein